MSKVLLLVLYGAAVVLANWMIRNVGIAIPGGTHLLPVGFGLLALQLSSEDMPPPQAPLKVQGELALIVTVPGRQG